MNIVLTIGSILLGAGLLYKGSEWLVGATERLARGLRVSKLIVGLTIVAIGTSLPELTSTLVAAFSGAPDIALGNIVGSNVANIGLVLGIAILIRPFRVDLKVFLRDGPWLVLGSVLMLIFATDGSVSRVEGAVLLAFAVLFYWSTIRHVRGSRLREKELPWQHDFKLKARDHAHNIALILAGVAALVAGGKLLVTGALNVAQALNVPELIIGLTIVAIGTSLPEIAIASWASTRGQSQITLGDILGSNISNIFVILGLVALISPIAVTGKAITFDLPAMILLTFLGLFFIKARGGLKRWEGLVLITAYFGYILWSFFVS